MKAISSPKNKLNVLFIGTITVVLVFFFLTV
ncbi:hypothetical protein A5889_001464 [Enterococcus sp. 9D6_DIV0238]|uniref:Uncharacterized protein n=1 Tax=Candidatus Enterococcus dunnyi TaxID=1834192 RepID=A0A200J8J9_9ENTE|nr:hypothetical protein A5889_001614 [Enterococcus sp. 9D6_DIV0238]